MRLRPLVGVLWLVLDWYPRKRRRGRFSNRAPFSDDDIVGAVAEPGVPRELVLELWEEVAGFADVPKSLLRPDDRFAVELAPEKGWELDSEMGSLGLALRRRAYKTGAAVDLGEIHTVREYIQEASRISGQHSR